MSDSNSDTVRTEEEDQFKDFLRSANYKLEEDNESTASSQDESEDDLELDENGCVLDFNLIADVLEDKQVGGNRTFNDMQLRDIERKNGILMNKILSHNKRPSQYKMAKPSLPKVSNSFVNRKKQQEKIDRENMMMLRRIEGVKPFGKSKPSKK